MIPSNYRGRFAPSPTGPLHFGSLVAAVGSFVDAKAHRGIWLVRIEDLDPPREVPGAAASILRTLEACALTWDEEVVYQSRRLDAYQAALDRLLSTGQVFPCGCSRKEIADSALAPDDTAIYPGVCRKGLKIGREVRSYRLRVLHETLVFDDAVQGTQTQNVAGDVGDFVVKRADGYFAYQLAVVVDDAGQGITDVVRGADLLDSTPRQLYLQDVLGLPRPRYLHLPVVLNHAGEKLSKQTLAPAIEAEHGGRAVFQALEFLGQSPPKNLSGAPPAEILTWAIGHWNRHFIPRRNDITI